MKKNLPAPQEVRAKLKMMSGYHEARNALSKSGFPVVKQKYVASTGGYVYCEPFETVFSATEDAVLYYIFIHRITDSLKLDGAPYIPVISKDIVEKISSYIPSEYENIFDSITYDSSDIDEMDINHFRNILRSIKNRKILEIEYCNAKGGKITEVG